MQRGPEWHKLRLGIPCSSEFSKIVKPGVLAKQIADGKIDASKVVSTQSPGYMFRLLAEWVTGEPVENYSSQWMDRGTELEDKAILAYEMLTDTETKPGGFITTDDGLIGCSPDRLIGDEGDLELKCPLIQTQVEYALLGTVGDEYMAQLQGRMLIHGRAWVDIFSYHPRLSIPAMRIYRDEKFIATLGLVLKTFTDQMLEYRLKLEKEYGPFTRPEPEPNHEKDWISDEDVERILEAQRRDDATHV